jgi:hypothetical protein
MALRPRITTGLPVSEKPSNLMMRQLLAVEKVFVNGKLVNACAAGESTVLEKSPPEARGQALPPVGETNGQAGGAVP